MLLTAAEQTAMFQSCLSELCLMHQLSVQQLHVSATALRFSRLAVFFELLLVSHET